MSGLKVSILHIDLSDWGFRLAPVHPIAFFRITLGSLLLLYWGSILMNASDISGVEWLFFCTVLANLFLLTIGAKMRIAAGIIAIVYGYEWWLLRIAGTTVNNIATESQALFFFCIFVILALSRADRGFSYAMHLRYDAWTEWEDVPVLPQRLLAGIISAVYLVIGYQKLWRPVFRSGSALRSALIGPWGTAMAARTARALPTVVFDWTTYVLKAFGLMLPFCLWIRSVRLWFFVGGALLHIAMALLLHVWWTLVLIPGYLLFLEPEEVKEVWEKKVRHLFHKTDESA
jgi:hypothetical protein